MSNKAAEGLIIKNLSMLEAVMTAFHTKIGPEICGEICKLIEEWAKEQIFDGKYDLYEEEYFWFAPESWKYRNEQDKEEWIARYDFVLVEDGKEINFVNCDSHYFLSPFINVGPVRSGIKFSIDRKAVKAGTLSAWKRFVHGHESYVELMKIGFQPIDNGNWFIPWSLDSSSLAIAYESENIADALNPISKVLDKIKNAHPIFEKLISDAKIYSFDTNKNKRE